MNIGCSAFCFVKDNSIRENVVQNYSLLMQDAIEVNIQTSKRAHAAVLQEIERGWANWQQLYVLKKQQIGIFKDWFRTKSLVI